MKIKARCRKCRTKIEFGKTYCEECNKIVQSQRNSHKNKKIS